MSDEASGEVDVAEDGSGVREPDGGAGSHLEEVPSGAGCTEIWEKLSEQREAADDG